MDNQKLSIKCTGFVRIVIPLALIVMMSVLTPMSKQSVNAQMMGHTSGNMTAGRTKILIL